MITLGFHLFVHGIDIIVPTQEKIWAPTNTRELSPWYIGIIIWLIKAVPTKPCPVILMIILLKFLSTSEISPPSFKKLRSPKKSLFQSASLANNFFYPYPLLPVTSIQTTAKISPQWGGKLSLYRYMSCLLTVLFSLDIILYYPNTFLIRARMHLFCLTYCDYNIPGTQIGI